MKLGVPWGQNRIRPEARETAKEAARRAGMSVDDWINSVIMQSAAGGGHQPTDPLSRRVNQVTRKGPEAYAPPHLRGTGHLPHISRGPSLSPPMAPPRPPVQWAPDEIDRAVAEISARQRALSGAPDRPLPPRPPAQRAAPRSPVPMQDLSGLEQQLRQITAQIETLRRPGVEEAINALREELAEIGRAMTEAMPRRALETLEAEIQKLGSRIAEGRQAGGDSATLAGLEHGIAEVHRALQGLTPAENLVGFNEAVNGLAHKIDLIVAQRDPASLQQLEAAIHTLRDISEHIASNETVSRLAQDVETLAARIERIATAAGAGDALASLEHRIAALADALAERSQNGDYVPPRLEALVDSLSDKIEKIQMSRSDNVAVGHLEDRIVQLVERLDASDSRLGNLEAIERGLADLLVHIDSVRTQQGTGIRGDASHHIDELREDVSRTRDGLNAVHSTLGIVVDRLAAIEREIRSEPRERRAAPAADEAELRQPVGKLAVRAVPAAPPPAPVPPPAPAAAPPPTAQPPAAPQRPPMPQGKRRPINPDLPPDEPLEPGSAQLPPQSPAARIAASQAALGAANPPSDPPPGGKSYFIAAARRAAKAALRDKTPRVPEAPVPDDLEAGTEAAAQSMRGRLMKRLKSLFVAASVIAIVIGSVQIATTFMNVGRSSLPKPVAEKSTNTSTLATPATDDASIITGSIQPAKPSDPQLPGMLPPTTNIGVAGAPTTVPANPDLPTTALSSAPELIGRSFIPQRRDITGSVAKPDRAPAAADKLPIAIGGGALRNAAIAGDPGAAYEVAARFAEGRGVPANLEEAARWFERAAAKGLAPAQFRYGSLLEKGHGVKKDLGQARRLYLAAAAQGNAKAMHNVAVLYAEGIDGRPDYGTAVQWFRKAADRGISDSQYNLGVLCARGLGTDKNYAESYKWFALAAAQGDREAAKKRDEIAAQLEPKALASAQHMAKVWVAQPQPDTAVVVPSPPGGWDQAEPAGQSPGKARSKAVGAFEIGKR